MQGDNNLILLLIDLLIDEITAYNQYAVDASINRIMGFKFLDKFFTELSDDENKHFHLLLDRIIFLNGIPDFKLNVVKISTDATSEMTNNLSLENSAREKYNKAIELCIEVKDGATRKILEEILSDEDQHTLEIEQQLEKIQKVGVQNYLTLAG